MQAGLSLEQTALWPERALTSDQGVHLGQVLFVVMGIINPGNADQVTLKALSKLWCQALPDISPCVPGPSFQLLQDAINQWPEGPTELLKPGSTAFLLSFAP